MSDRFPKQYVLERIAARMGSLGLKIEAEQKIVSDIQDRLVGKLQSVLTNNVETIQKYSKKAGRAQKAFDEAETYAEKRKIVDAVSGSLNLESTPYTGTWRGDKGTSLDAHMSTIEEYRKERTALTHAKLHLEGMPVTEFSLASLRSLGLLSALKFDLEEAQRLAS